MRTPPKGAPSQTGPAALRGALKPNARVLIVRLGALGDVINTLPALTALRQALPQAHLAWVVEPGSASLLAGHPLLNEVILMPRRRGGRGLGAAFAAWTALRAIGPALLDGAFDAALDFQGNLRSGLVVRRTRAPLRVGYARGGCRDGNWLFTNYRVPCPLTKGHRVERALALLRGLGLQFSPAPQPIVPKEDVAERRAEQFIASSAAAGQRWVAIHAGTSEFGRYKRWSAERYVELISQLQKELKATVLLTWGLGEREQAAAIAQASPGAVLAPETKSLLELAALLRRCHLFIGSDSGPMHLASAVGVPVVGLFGPKDPAQYRPYFSPCRIVEVELPCRPCRKRRCNDPRCMGHIQPVQVLAAAKDLWQETAPSA